jgi:hypothetical protein
VVPNGTCITAIRTLTLALVRTLALMLDLTSLVDEVLVQTTVSKQKNQARPGNVCHHQHHRHQQPALHTPPFPPFPPPPRWYTPAFGLWPWVALREYHPINEKVDGLFLVEM